jgi:hypothetical protein
VRLGREVLELGLGREVAQLRFGREVRELRLGGQLAGLGGKLGGLRLGGQVPRLRPLCWRSGSSLLRGFGSRRGLLENLRGKAGFVHRRVYGIDFPQRHFLR